MAKTIFHKMHGLGNDFVIIDARETELSLNSAQACALANRNTGIGCDQLIVLHPSDQADLAMRIFNADGGEVEACGNATRCVVALMKRDVSIETSSGILHGSLTDDTATVDMGAPRFDWKAIPLDYAMDTSAMPLAWGELSAPAAVNVGNPHAIFFVEDANAVSLETLGPEIEHDPVFPERVNVNVAHIAADVLHLRVWERGAGLTLACGTGACASAVAAIRRELLSSPVDVNLPGGMLTITWNGGDAPIFMSGPATYVFQGEIDLEALS